MSDERDAAPGADETPVERDPDLRSGRVADALDADAAARNPNLAPGGPGGPDGPDGPDAGSDDDSDDGVDPAPEARDLP